MLSFYATELGGYLCLILSVFILISVIEPRIIWIIGSANGNLLCHGLIDSLAHFPNRKGQGQTCICGLILPFGKILMDHPVKTASCCPQAAQQGSISIGSGNSLFEVVIAFYNVLHTEPFCVDDIGAKGLIGIGGFRFCVHIVQVIPDMFTSFFAVVAIDEFIH